MNDDDSRSFIARVRAYMADMHPSERRLAETVLNFPGDMAGYTASEIAELAGVSNATVSRFVRKIGYASYDEARKAVRDAGERGTALLRFGAAESDAQRATESHLAQSRLNLEKTYAELDPGLVDDLVASLHATPRVWVAGYRAGHPLAAYLAWQIGLVLPSVTLIPKPGETFAETAATFEADDILVLLALRRAPGIVSTIVETACETRTKVALIGDVADLEILPVHWRIACATASTGPLLNHTGVLAAYNLIAMRILEKSGAEARQRLARIEEMHDRFGEL